MMATTANFVALFVTVMSACCRLASCGPFPGLGPSGCLISRIEVVPCSKPSSPGANQFQVLTTEFDVFSPFPTCTSREIRQRNIDVSGTTNQVFSINSPGFNGRNSYLADALVEYNIQCGDDRLAYLDINQINIEGTTCSDPNRNDANVCVDYFRVIRPSGLGFTESCGTDASENSDQLEFGSFQAFFRSSPGETTPGGFEGTVVCFDPAEADMDSCDEVQDTTATPLKRKKRARNRQVRPRKPKKLRKGFSAEDLVEQGFTAVRVPHGASATFFNGVIRFTDNLDNLSPINGLPKIPYIKFFKDFDGLNRPRVFIRTAKTREGSLIRFPGPGLLFHKHGLAIFLRFVINPKGLQPTEEERKVILQLTGAIQDAFRLNATDDITTDPPTTEPITTKPTPTKKPRYWYSYYRKWRKQRDIDAMKEPIDEAMDEIDLISETSHLRQKRQATILIFTADQFELACANREACNPVLRASANSVIESSGQTCPT